MRRVLPLVLLVPLAALPLSGCVAVAAGAVAGAGYAQYRRNETYRDFRTELEPTYRAALAALTEAGHALPQLHWLGTTEGQIEGGELCVRVERHPGGVTRVRVRIGTFDSGDHRRRADLLLEGMARRLEG